MHWAHFVSVSVFAVIASVCECVCACVSNWALNELQKVGKFQVSQPVCVCVCVQAVWPLNELQSQMCTCDKSLVKIVFLQLEG